MGFTDAVVGVDFGTLNTRVSVMAHHQRMPSVVRNNFSLESTPTVVAFDDEKRYIGEEAAAKVTSRPQWAANLLRLHFQGKTSEELGLLYELSGEKLSTPRGDFDLVHITSMLFSTVLGYCRRQEDGPSGSLPSKIVVAVPKCTPSARCLIESALRLVGFEKEQIVVTTDGTAAAACYRGLRFESLPKTLEEAKPVAIVDIGHGYNTVTVACIAKEGLRVLGEGSGDEGSRRIDDALMQKMLDDTKGKMGDFSPRAQQKAFSRIRKESTKAKEVLSTTTKHKVQIEALTDTYDLEYDTTQDDVVTFSASLRESVTASLQAALTAAGLTAADITEVQAIGGGWRTPVVHNHIKTICARGDEGLCVHLDPVQTVAQGCALIALWRPPVAKAIEGEAAAAAAVDEEVNGVHYLDFQLDALPEGEPHAAEYLEGILQQEQAIQAEEAVYNKRVEARNVLEAYILSLPSVAIDAGMAEATVEELSKKVQTIDEWMMSEEGDAATPEELAKRLQDVKEDVAANFPQIAAHLEKQRLEDEEKDRQRAEEAKLAKDTKEPKTDPQRLKAAQERREQGVAQFKQEHYAEAITRFVQALAHLKVRLHPPDFVFFPQAKRATG